MGCVQDEIEEIPPDPHKIDGLVCKTKAAVWPLFSIYCSFLYPMCLILIFPHFKAKMIRLWIEKNLKRTILGR